MKTLNLTKGKQHFRIAYEDGDETTVLHELVSLANKPDSGIDWFDAAVMSHQLGLHFAGEFRKIANEERAKKGGAG